MKNFRSNRSKTSFKGGALALALVAFGITACQTQPDTTGAPQQDQTATEQPATDTPTAQGTDDVEAGDLSGNLEDYIGRTISIRGEVVEVLGNDAFVIGGGVFNDDVVVFNTSGNPVVLPGDEVTERVQVTGQVQQVTVDSLNQQYGLNLDQETFSDYENNPAILAESIVLAPEPGEISDNPQAFYNERIALEGGIDEEYGANAFTIGGAGFLGGSNILVISEEGGFANFADVDDVVVLGELRPFNLAQLEQEYNLTLAPDARQALESDYDQESVLVAEQIFPINR
jgi:hypothetical protein